MAASRPIVVRFWEKVEKTSGCWNWTATTDKKGYGKFRPVSTRPMVLAHRYSWELKHGVRPDLHVLHKCDNPRCVRPTHLYLGDDIDNVADRERRGRSRYSTGDFNGSRKHPERLARGDRNGMRMHPDSVNRGESAYQSTVTTVQVLQIRKLAEDGIGKTEISRRFQIGFGCVCHIVARRSWRHF